MIAKWALKHPCTNCGTGYGLCVPAWSNGLMCCDSCDHPTRWEPNSFTKEDYIEMWAGREMPDRVRRFIDSL